MRIQGDPEKDFFEQNPEVKYFPDFQKIIKEEGSKERASRVMWAVYLTRDPNSDWYHMSTKEKEALAKESYLKDQEFDFDEYKWLIKAYEKNLMDVTERNFSVWVRKLEQMTNRLDELSFGDKNDKLILSYFTSLDKIWDTIYKVRDKFETHRKQQAEESRGDLESGGLSNL